MRTLAYREARRRRVLIDECVRDETPSMESAGKDATAPLTCRYVEAAIHRQPQITTLIPSRRRTIWCLTLMTLAIIAGIEALYACVFVRWPDRQSWLAMLDVGRTGSLASWFGSFLFTVGAAMSIVVFSLRRHRIDDYQGRYRLWGWTAAVLLLAGLDVSVGLHRLVAAVPLREPFTGQTLGPELTWMLAFAVAFVWPVVCYASEIRASRGATAFLSLSGLAYATAALGRLGFLPLPSATATTLAISSATLVAHAALTFSVLLFARYVYRDAQGKLPLRRAAEPAPAKPKRKSRKAAQTESTDATAPAKPTKAAKSKPAPAEPAETKPPATPAAVPAAAPTPAVVKKADLTSPPTPTKTEPAKTEPAKPAPVKPAPVKPESVKPESKPVASETNDLDDDDADDDDSLAHLSKTERKRLRKQQRRERRSAA